MTVSGWGGITSFINEGLRRAEEDKRRKEEEERKRREEEARRASRITSSIDSWQGKGAIQGPQPRPTTPQPQTPSLGIENPYKVDTSTPPVGYTPPAQSVGPTLPSITPAAPTQPVPEPPAPEVQKPKAPAPPTSQPTVATAQMPLVAALPSLAQNLTPLLQQGWSALGQQNPAKTAQQVYEGASEGALQIPYLGLEAAKLANSFGNVLETVTGDRVSLPDNVQQIIDQRIRQDALDQAGQEKDPMKVWQEVATPGQAIKNRYAYNLWEAPDDPATEVLRQFAPVVNVMLNAAEAWGYVDERGMYIPKSGIVLGDPSRSLGEVWGHGWRAANIYNHQYEAYLQSLGGGAPVDPPNMVASLEVARNDFLAAITPTTEQLKTATPEYVAAAIAYTQSMTHHGLAATEAMFDDLMNMPGKIAELGEQARNAYSAAGQLPPGEEREQLLWQAAAYGQEAYRLQNTHPLELFEKNANWWMALPGESILGITNIVDIGSDILKLTPKARRILQGERLAATTAEQATQALQQGVGVAATVEQRLIDFGNDLGNDLLKRGAQLYGSRAMLDARNNWRALVSLVGSFTEKSDLRTIFKAYATDANSLLQNGIPAVNLKAPWVQQMFGADPLATVPFGPASIADYNAVKSYVSLAPVADFIDQLPSLRGEGPAEWGDVAADLYTLITRGAGERFGVANLPGVPVGTDRATTKLLGNGTATVQYYDGKTLLHETAATPLAQANQLVEDFRTFAKTNQEIQSNPLEQVGNLQRSFIGVTQLYANTRNLINNVISNRSFVMADGVWSWKSPNQMIAYLQGVTGNAIAFDEVARRLFPDMDTSGGIGSMFAFGDKLPVVGGVAKKLKNLVQWDERNLKLMSYSRTHEDFMLGPGWKQFNKAAQDYFASAGWTDPKQINNAITTLFDAGIRGGKGALMETFYTLANGGNVSSVATVTPHYRDIWGGASDALDSIVKSVTPENLQATLQQLDDLTKGTLAQLDNLTEGYATAAGRHTYTNLDQQQEVAEMLARMQTLAKNLGVDVGPIAEQIGELQKNINQNVVQLAQMAGTNEGAAAHIINLWRQIEDLRGTVRTNLNRIGDALLHDVPSAERGAAFDDFRMMQSAYYEDMARSAHQLIEQTRQAIAQGVPASAPMLDPFKALSELGSDIQAVFEANKLDPKVFSRDALAQTAAEAGRKGTQAFVAQMQILLQRFPTSSGFDHWVDALDDVAVEGRKIFGPLERQLADIRAQIDALKPATEQDKRVWGQINKLWRQYATTRNTGFVEYYTFAYSRYQAASAAIVQAGKGIDNLPTFKPLDGWGLPQWGNSPQVTLLGINIRNAQEFLIRTPDGSTMAIPRRFVPMDVIQNWNKMAQETYAQLSGEVGRLADSLFAQGTGFEEVDKLVKNIRSATKNSIFDAVVDSVAQHANNPHGSVELGSDLGRWLAQKVQGSADALRAALPGIAQANVSAQPTIDLNQVRGFANQFGPLWDNLLAGANRAGEQMAGFSMIDFINRYGADAVAGLFVPFSYWATRQGKNMVERMLFKPAIFAHVSRAQKAIEAESGRQGLPARYNDGINTGINIPYSQFPGIFGEDANDETLMLQSPIPRWMPFGLNYIFQGWSDMDRANSAAELLLGRMEASGFPGWDGFFNGLMLGSELMGAAGQAPYQWWRDLVAAGAGRGEEISLANYAYYANLYAQLRTATSGEYTDYVNRPYDPYLASRDVANAGFGVDDSASPTLAAGQAAVEGRELAPEFLASHPDSPADWNQAARREGLENFLWNLVNGLVGLTFSTMDPKEPERLEAQRTYTQMGYGPNNPTGSRERTQMLDPESENWVPGLAAGQSTYQVVGEGPQRDTITPSPNAFPYLPTYEVRRLDEGIVLGEYLDKREEVYDKYSAEEAAILQQHPEWTGTLVDDPAYDAFFDDNAEGTGFYQRRTAEIDALDAAYPTVAEKYKEPTAASLRGANPIETTDAAVSRLIEQAREESEHLKPGDYPKDGSRSEKAAWNKQNDAYDEAVRARLRELMADPSAASAAVFNRPLDATGPYSEQPAPQVGPPDRTYLATPQATLQSETTGEIGTTGQPAAGTPPGEPLAAAATTRAPALGQPGQPAAAGVGTANMGSVTPHPDNQWFDAMTAAEAQYGLPAGLLQAVAQNESGFNPGAESSAGAQGIMQIMPPTWDEWAAKVGVDDVWDPEDNIQVSAAYLSWLWKQLPQDERNIDNLMRAYNWGIGNYQKLGSEAAPPETKAYSATIASSVSSVNMTTQVMGNPTQQQFIRPVDGGPELVTQGYGANKESYREWNGEHGHEGIDYGVPVGTPVKASAGGTVVFVGSGNGFDNYGKYVVIDHGNGYKSYYGHLSGFDVKEGDTVEQGQLIAKSGNTGYSSGPHLHFALRKDGDTSGPYGMVDPTDFILGKAGGKAAPSNIATTQAPSGSTGTINFGVTADEALDRAENKYTTPERQAFDEAREGAWQQAYGRIESTYPKHATLFDEYRAVNDEDREQWRNENPMIRALNLLVYNEKEHAQVEELFGKGSVELWANIPRGANVSEEAGKYYRQHPTSFLAKAWIQGRPQPFDEDKEFNPEEAVARDFGNDYETAKEMFGDDIWDIVRTYYASVPMYVEGGDNSAWIAFKEQYPQFDEWRRWWYALMGDQAQTAQQGGWRGFSGGFNGFDPSQGEHPAYVENVEARRMEAPAYQTGQGQSTGDWRRYLELSRLGVRNPRR